ncbi:MAG: hypothetical protein ACI9EF_002386 [Pseudohongiellaceae bacterium]|jgi:hypothetical protein
MAGVLFFSEPIARNDSPSGPLVPAGVGLLAYVVLFDGTARQVRSACKAAFVVGASQFLLVNVAYMLTGKHGLATGLASTLLMLVPWSCVPFAYAFFAAEEQCSTQAGDRQADGTTRTVKRAGCGGTYLLFYSTEEATRRRLLMASFVGHPD